MHSINASQRCFKHHTRTHQRSPEPRNLFNHSLVLPVLSRLSNSLLTSTACILLSTVPQLQESSAKM